MKKWEEQVEEILKKHYQGDELSEQMKRASLIVSLGQGVEIPSGEDGWIVKQMLKMASEDLRPLEAVYLGFELGVCWERLNKEKADAG